MNCPTLPPVANGGMNLTVQIPRNSHTRIYLNGSASYSPSSTTLSYLWIQTAGVSVTLHNPNTLNPSFSPPKADMFSFMLKVSDGCSSSFSNTSVYVQCGSDLSSFSSSNSIFSPYNGLMTVPFMSYGYDGTISAPCETYSWALVNYSSQTDWYSPSSSSTSFVKTPGFIVLMSVVSLIAVVGLCFFFAANELVDDEVPEVHHQILTFLND